MKSYNQALRASLDLANMPDATSKTGLFIIWAEDICELLARIYDRDYESVCEDMQELMGFDTED